MPKIKTYLISSDRALSSSRSPPAEYANDVTIVEQYENIK